MPKSDEPKRKKHPPSGYPKLRRGAYTDRQILAATTDDRQRGVSSWQPDELWDDDFMCCLARIEVPMAARHFIMGMSLLQTFAIDVPDYQQGGLIRLGIARYRKGSNPRNPTPALRWDGFDVPWGASQTPTPVPATTHLRLLLFNNPLSVLLKTVFHGHHGHMHPERALILSTIEIGLAMWAANPERQAMHAFHVEPTPTLDFDPNEDDIPF